MEFAIERDEFVRGLSRAQSVIEKKSTLPVLSNVLINATKEGLELSATDLEVGIRGTIAAEVKKTGVVTLPAKRLFDIVRELPQGKVNLSLSKNDWVTLKYENGEMLLSGLPADDFPMIPAFEDDGFATFEPDLLADMIGKTLFAVSTDETRHYLNGVYVEVEQETSLLRMVATDGHRLSMVERTVPSAANLDIAEGVILPKKGVNEFNRMLADADADVQVSIRDRNVIVKSGTAQLFLRLIDGEFPDYTRVIPVGNERKARVDRGKLLQALRRVSVMSVEMTRGVKLTLTNGGMEVSANNPSLGEAKESLPVNYDGGDLEIGFNAKYFIDVLGVIDDGEVELAFNDELSPALIKADTAEGFSSVIMPMRL